MLSESEKSVERIKLEIDFYKENLKFLNSFYLPLASGITVLFIGKDPVPYKVGWILAGIFLIVLLTLLKKRVLIIISKLIKEL
jgi:hypothetical protein